MRSVSASILALAFATSAFAAAEVAEVRSPDGGPWAGQSPGAFVVFKSNAWDAGPSAVYRRELLLGVDRRGIAVVQYATSDTADGPWDKPTLQARPVDPKPNRTAPLGDKSFPLDGKPIACTGTQSEFVVDGNRVVVEQWNDRATGRKVRQMRTTRAANAAFGDGEVIEEVLESVVSQRIGDRDVTVANYRSTTHRDGKAYMSRRFGFAEDVPGRRTMYQRWVGGGDPPGRLAMDEVAVATGIDADTVAFVTGLVPATAPTTTQAHQ